MKIDNINSRYKVNPINPVHAISDRQQNSRNYFNQKQTKQITSDAPRYSKDGFAFGLYIDIFV